MPTNINVRDPNQIASDYITRIRALAGPRHPFGLSDSDIVRMALRFMLETEERRANRNAARTDQTPAPKRGKAGG